MKKTILFLSLMILSLPCFAKTAAQDLSAALQNIKTFSAHFDQRIASKSGKILSKSSGTLQIQRPGRFNWETAKPNALRVVADGTHIWTYDIDLEQIIQQDAKAVIVGSPAALLAGKLVNIEQDFKVNYLDKSKSSYSLIPLNKEAAFEDIKIGFKDQQLVSMEIHDALGQRIKTNFTNVKLNLSLDPSIFVFNPPKNVDIIVNK